MCWQTHPTILPPAIADCRCCAQTITCGTLRRDGTSHLRKDTDYETAFACAGGIGILREEVWVDEAENVVRYNLAFILPHRYGRDNGRVLGFDNAHGIHERHYFGEVQTFRFHTYAATANLFYQQMEELRRRYEDEDIL